MSTAANEPDRTAEGLDDLFTAWFGPGYQQRARMASQSHIPGRGSLGRHRCCRCGMERLAKSPRAVTDEMVESALLAAMGFDASQDDDRPTDDVYFREQMRASLEAALGVKR